MSDSIHEWDGAYVLGALSPDDRRRYEAHLAECAECSASVRDLAGLPGLLGRLDPEEALALRDLPDDDALRQGAHAPERAAGVARRVRRRRRRTRIITGLVLVAVLGVVSVGGWGLIQALQPGAAQQVAASTSLTPVGGSRLTADLRISSVGWGTRFDWSCAYGATTAGARGGYPPTSYSLVVHTRSGAATTVATWRSDGSAATGLVASSAIPTDSIASVDIRVTGSSTPLAETRL